jgi:hypothetical protein
LTFVFFITGILTSCASVFGNGKTIELNTNPNTTAIVYNSKGAVIETTTSPETISFKRAGNYTLR